MPKPGTDGLYTIRLRGEKNVYQFRGSDCHTLEAVCNMLSDLTGYKRSYLHDTVLDRMAIGSRKNVKIANMWEEEAPFFVVMRVT